ALVLTPPEESGGGWPPTAGCPANARDGARVPRPRGRCRDCAAFVPQGRDGGSPIPLDDRPGRAYRGIRAPNISARDIRAGHLCSVVRPLGAAQIGRAHV